MKKLVNKVTKVLIPTVLSLFVFASIASAHVTVSPNTSTTDAWETYTLKVPVEKNVATTKVTVKVPSGVEIESYQPVQGWNYSTKKDSSGNVKTFTYTATGQGILPGQFQQFVFVAKNPEKAEKAAWDAYQYYKDGSIVEWTGNEGADTPHSITDIVIATTTAHPAAQTPAHDEKPKAEAAATPAKANNTLPIVAIALSAIALAFSFRKK